MLRSFIPFQLRRYVHACWMDPLNFLSPIVLLRLLMLGTVSFKYF